MDLSRDIRTSTSGLLYPMMVIAAIAVIVFSILGIASIPGWMPHAMVGSGTAVAAQTVDAPVPSSTTQSTGAAFQCAECGVIESIREIERRGTLWTTPVAAAVEPAKIVVTDL